MKLVTRLKERPSRSSSLAAPILGRWCSTPGRGSHRGDRPRPGTQCWHVSPDIRAIFEFLCDRWKTVNPSRPSPLRARSRTVVTDCGTTDLQSALRHRWSMTNWCNGCRNSVTAAGACGKPGVDAHHWLPHGGGGVAWDPSRFALSRCAARVIPLLGGEPRQRPAAKEIDIAGGSVCPMSWLT